MKKPKKFRVEHQKLIDITTSLSGGNERENNRCIVKEIQLAYDKKCEIIYKIYPFVIKQKLDIQELITNNVQKISSNFPELDKFTKDSYKKVFSFEETVCDLISKKVKQKN